MPMYRVKLGRLEGHSGSVEALCVLADRLGLRDDETIRLWDPNSGAETARLAGENWQFQTADFKPISGCC
jgi:hypothetical protein